MEAAIIDRGRGPEIAGPGSRSSTFLHYLQAGWDDKAIACRLEPGNRPGPRCKALYRNTYGRGSGRAQRINERIALGNPPHIQAKLAAAHAKLQARLLDIRASRIQGNGDAEHSG